MGTNTTKPYKIQEANGNGRVGITAVDFQDMRNTAMKKLNVQHDYVAYLDDGTAVLTQNYFQRLPPQTCFTFLAPHEQTDISMDLLQLEVLTLRISKNLAGMKIKDEVQNFLKGDNAEVINRALLDYITSLKSNIDAETREEDLEWFHGLHDKYQTKEEVMKDRAKSRIRNYYQKTKEYVLEQNSGKRYLSLLEALHQELRLNDYYGEYFVRSGNKDIRVCDELGWFKCQGKFNENFCSARHSINPYASKETRIMFSTWNLDHVIEKSREILPTLIQALKNCPKNQDVNWEYFYDLLFTTKNLKLVHIVCHVKEAHSGKTCDKRQLFKPKRKNTKRKKESCEKTVKRRRRK